MQLFHRTLVVANNSWVQRVKRRADPARVRTNLNAYLSETFSGKPYKLHADYARHQEWMKQRVAEAAIPIEDLASPLDCETLYLVARAAGIRRAVDTGVFYGALTGCLAAAIRDNGGGQLYSVDLPKPALHGWLVPSDPTVRWDLHVGDAKEILPRLLSKVAPIDLFLHDSLHSLEHMFFEFREASRALRPRGILVSHDVVAVVPWLNGFQRFCLSQRLPYRVFRNLGVAVAIG
ncbi:MAG: class I SAM-dependent methyltransferase [Candidatus Methylomirabilaceae bacterium]